METMNYLMNRPDVLAYVLTGIALLFYWLGWWSRGESDRAKVTASGDIYCRRHDDRDMMGGDE